MNMYGIVDFWQNLNAGLAWDRDVCKATFDEQCLNPTLRTLLKGS